MHYFLNIGARRQLQGGLDICNSPENVKARFTSILTFWFAQNNQNCCYPTCFTDTKYTPNVFAVGASSRTPLGEFTSFCELDLRGHFVAWRGEQGEEGREGLGGEGEGKEWRGRKEWVGFAPLQKLLQAPTFLNTFYCHCLPIALHVLVHWTRCVI